LRKIVELKELQKYFSGIYGSPANKHEHIKNILREYNLFPQNVLFIGDAPKDKEAASLSNLNFIARISKHSILAKEKYKINDFTGIYDVIDKINMSDLIC